MANQILPYGLFHLIQPTGASLQSVFEGMKAFKNKDNEVLLFRKEEN